MRESLILFSTILIDEWKSLPRKQCELCNKLFILFSTILIDEWKPFSGKQCGLCILESSCKCTIGLLRSTYSNHIST